MIRQLHSVLLVLVFPVNVTRRVHSPEHVRGVRGWC